MNTYDVVIKIANDVKTLGGRAFFVGGYVRDYLLGKTSTDYDIEVYGLSFDELNKLLTKYGEISTPGKAFGIQTLKEFDIDIALPRQEIKVGEGHKDFEIITNPNLDFKDACIRRDFTINSMLMDVLTNEIIDLFNGQKDLKNKVLRHIDSNKFVEDPLRVFRLAQFAARFEYEIAPETLELCKTINTKTLSKERVQEETKKALLLANKPSIYFRSLKAMNQLDNWFHEVSILEDVEQDKLYHPEGNVFIHTMDCLDRAVAFRDKVSNPYYFMMLALVHDFGKVTTTEFFNGHIHAYDHDKAGISFIDSFINVYGGSKEFIEYLKNGTLYHMRLHILLRGKSRLFKYYEFFDKTIAPIDMIYFVLVDKGFKETTEEEKEYLFSLYNNYKEITKVNVVTPYEIKALGIPQKHLYRYLLLARRMQLRGRSKEQIIEQIKTQAKEENLI